LQQTSSARQRWRRAQTARAASSTSREENAARRGMEVMQGHVTRHGPPRGTFRPCSERASHSAQEPRTAKCACAFLARANTPQKRRTGSEAWREPEATRNTVSSAALWSAPPPALSPSRAWLRPKAAQALSDALSLSLSFSLSPRLFSLLHEDMSQSRGYDAYSRIPYVSKGKNTQTAEAFRLTKPRRRRRRTDRQRAEVQGRLVRGRLAPTPL